MLHAEVELKPSRALNAAFIGLTDKAKYLKNQLAEAIYIILN
jgi:hypothetical protein